MAQDIILDEQYNPVIRNGDFDVFEADEQHMQLILLSEPGWWKAHPLTGVGLMHALKGPFSVPQRQALAQRIRLHMQMDGYTVQRCEVAPDTTIDLQCTR
jgi:hypothetical protein